MRHAAHRVSTGETLKISARNWRYRPVTVDHSLHHAPLVCGRGQNTPLPCGKIHSNSACIMEPVCSLPCSQQHITELYPAPRSSSRIPMKQILQDHSLCFHVLFEDKLRRLVSNPGRNEVYTVCHDCFVYFFDVLLTVHLSIILVINQLGAQTLVL